jgi:high affinity sulfate transporter 1
VTARDPPPPSPLVRATLPRGIARWAPGLAMLRSYRRAWLMNDIVAGVVLTAVLVPVGMGYAEAAGLPAITGLYATIMPLIVYAAVGSSRVMVLGPDSALAGLIAATILPLAAGDPDRALALASVLALLAGALCCLAGLFRFGFLADLFSKPIRYGYLNGIALTVLVGQLPKLLGFSVDGDSLLQRANGLVRGMLSGQINRAACAIGVTCLILMLGIKRWAPRWPGVLIAVVGATLAVAFFDLAETAGVAVVGALPQGLPAGRLPHIALEDLRGLLPGAVAIALLSFVDMSVLSRTFAARGGHAVDTDQEIVALGLANLAGGLFQGFSVSGSASRTPVAEAAGAKTQLTGLVGAACIALLLLIAPATLRDLPHTALSAVVIVDCLALIEIPGVVRLYRMRRGEFALSMICFLGVALLGVIQGIFLAVALALLAFIWRAWWPYHAVLGRVDGLKGYHDVVRHPEARRIPGLVLFRWDAPLFFANAEIFRERVLQAVAEAPTPTAWVVVAAEPITDVDMTAADMLAELDRALHAAGMDLCFAEMKGPVKDLLKRYGLFTNLGAENFFPTIGQAVDHYLVRYQVVWQDWDEDRPGDAQGQLP